MILPARHTCPACRGDGATSYPLRDTLAVVRCWTCRGRGHVRDWTGFQIRALDAAALVAALATLGAAAAYTAGLPLIPATLLAFLES
ncbi:hypothetical protein ACWCSD_31890 [Nonomuraea sp. NPDC001684]